MNDDCDSINIESISNFFLKNNVLICKVMALFKREWL